MLWIISHEGFGELRVSPREQADLARIGVRGALGWKLDTLAAWQARLAALAAGRAPSAVLRSAREGFLLRMSRQEADGRVNVFVDGRQMEKDLWGHFWEFSVDIADVANLASQCAAAVRRLGAEPDVRPTSAIANDPERRARVARRFPLVVETADSA